MREVPDDSGSGEDAQTEVVEFEALYRMEWTEPDATVSSRIWTHDLAVVDKWIKKLAKRGITPHVKVWVE